MHSGDGHSTSLGHPVLDAARGGNTKIIRDFIVKHTDKDNRDLYNKALFFASMGGNNDVIAMLLEHGADVNAPLPYGVTPLMQAKTLETAKLLITHGANIFAHEDQDIEWTALTAARAGGHPDIAEYLSDLLLRASTIHALQAADDLATAPEGYPSFPPELIERALRPLIKVCIEEDQQ